MSILATHSPRLPKGSRCEPPSCKDPDQNTSAESAHLDHKVYPAVGAPSTLPSLHDVGLIQKSLSNKKDFATSDFCEVAEIRVGADGRAWGHFQALEDTGVLSYIETLHSSDGDSYTQVRSIFCFLVPQAETSFGLQISLTYSTMLRMLQSLGVNPHFINNMLGQPDYWAPLQTIHRDPHGVALRAELCYQFPRYITHERRPCSIYIGYDFADETTTSIICSGQEDRWVGRAKQRFADYCSIWALNAAPADQPNMCSGTPASASTSASEPRDPFLMQSMLCHESLVEARKPIAEVRRRLYEVLGVVGEYAKQPFDRSNLKDITNQLHSISQDADSLHASAAMGSMVTQHCATARRMILEECRRQRARRSRRNRDKSPSSTLSTGQGSNPGSPSRYTSPGEDVNGPSSACSDTGRGSSEKKDDSSWHTNSMSRGDFEGSNVGDALEYLIQSLESQMRWLQSYKSRKDIAMNLVFNLVTQQDSETSTSIARDAKADSSSMKAIAVLTMVFLPATTVSSFFGMAFFDRSDQGAFRTSAAIWMFVAITAPLTAMTFVLWLYWWHIIDFWERRKRLHEAGKRAHVA